MTMTTHTQTPEHESMTAWILSGGSNYTLCQERESLSGLEGGTWGILTHDTAVEQRFPHILTQDAVVLRTLAPHHHTGIVRGRRHHAKHLARRGFDGHDTSDLTLQKPLTKGL